MNKSQVQKKLIVLSYPLLTFNLILAFTLLFFSYSLAQQSKLSKAVCIISEYIASEKFEEETKGMTDREIVDLIYLKGLYYCSGSYSEALLSLTFATLPYREIPLTTPLLGIKLKIPIYSADEKIFNKKNKNLPAYFLDDSPKNNFGDRDKLAHFFGSAFISYSIPIFDLAEGIGYFVEEFEAEFKVQSMVDERDLTVNSLGSLFGKSLSNDRSILPSQILKNETGNSDRR